MHKNPKNREQMTQKLRKMETNQENNTILFEKATDSFFNLLKNQKKNQTKKSKKSKKSLYKFCLSEFPVDYHTHSPLQLGAYELND